jgi:isopenicillin-N epimerase
VKRLLAKNIIASTTPYGKSYARLAAGIMNSEADVKTAVRAVEQI